MKNKFRKAHFAAVVVCCFSSCSQNKVIEPGANISNDDWAAITESLLIEIADPSQNESIFLEGDSGINLNREVFLAGGSLVRDGRLLLLLHSVSWTFDRGHHELFAPFDTWVRQNDVEKVRVWMNGGGWMIVGFEDDSTSEPVNVELIGAELKLFDKAPKQKK